MRQEGVEDRVCDEQVFDHVCGRMEGWGFGFRVCTAIVSGIMDCSISASSLINVVLGDLKVVVDVLDQLAKRVQAVTGGFGRV